MNEELHRRINRNNSENPDNAGENVDGHAESGEVEVQPFKFGGVDAPAGHMDFPEIKIVKKKDGKEKPTE